MINKFTIYNLQFTILIAILAVISLLLTFNYKLPTASADTAPCSTQALNARVTDGLISAAEVSDTKFGSNIGKCVIDFQKAPFAPYKIPSYEDLKSIYYTQSKAAKTDATPASGHTANQGTLRSALNSADVVLIKGNLDLNGNLGGTAKTAVVFVDGNLNFGNRFEFGNNNTGVVFVVGGNVNIAQSVTRIDAVIISFGTIRTAGADCATNSVNVGASSNALIINGSLISLDPGSIIFCRKLTDNSLPAEKIINQVKYLFILRNLFADTYQKWSEIQ